ncbi:MAG: lantibiotic dehydratase C-terminal domain-containing protein [Gammaproteobacteria bacterium]
MDEYGDLPRTKTGRSAHWRQNRERVERLLGTDPDEGPYAAVRDSLAARANHARTILSSHADLDPTSIVSDLIHLTCNRILGRRAREWELVVCDHLRRHYLGIIGRLGHNDVMEHEIQ